MAELQQKEMCSKSFDSSSVDLFCLQNEAEDVSDQKQTYRISDLLQMIVIQQC